MLVFFAFLTCFFVVGAVLLSVVAGAAVWAANVSPADTNVNTMSEEAIFVIDFVQSFSFEALFTFCL